MSASGRFYDQLVADGGVLGPVVSVSTVTSLAANGEWFAPQSIASDSRFSSETWFVRFLLAGAANSVELIESTATTTFTAALMSSGATAVNTVIGGVWHETSFKVEKGNSYTIRATTANTLVRAYVIRQAGF